MENQTYLQLLKDAFQFLFEEYNYKVVQHVAADPFWNAQTYLQSDELILQIVNDWSQISLDIRPYNPNVPVKKQFVDFYDFIIILELLEIPELKDLEELYTKILNEMFCDDSEWCNMVEKERGIIQMKLIADIFHKYYDQIMAIFSEEQFSQIKAKLASLRKIKAQNL